MSFPDLTAPQIGDTVAVQDESGVIRFGVFLGEEDGYSQIAFPTGNVRNEQVKGVVGRPVPA